MTVAKVGHDRQRVLRAALAYADAGLRVVPIRPGHKHPPMDNWPNAATSDPIVIRSWWNGPYRRCGVGVATGAGSQVWVLDVDVAAGKRGAKSLADLEASYGSLPDTVEAVTGTGGRHLYFAWDPEHPVHNDQSGRAGSGLDVRGDGGQVVTAPTAHPVTGEPYRWRLGRAPGEHPFARAPGWLYALIERTPDRPVVQAAALRLLRSPAPVTGLGGHSPAEAFNASTTWDELLTRDGWTLARVLSSGEQRWTRPGKTPREGTSATVGHAGRDVLKIFTSSVAGLDADRAYSRFGYEAAIRHGGDRSALASAIRRQMNSAGSTSRPGESRARLQSYADAMGTRRTAGSASAPSVGWRNWPSTSTR